MDITVDISVSTLKYTTWLRTSYIALGIDEAAVVDVEFGVDQGDAFANFIDEASREVLKLFITRQGSVSGLPFEFSDTNIIYRFKQGEPALSENITLSLTESLSKSVEYAIYTFLTGLWLQHKGYSDSSAFITSEYMRYTDDIERILYRLHD